MTGQLAPVPPAEGYVPVPGGRVWYQIVGADRPGVPLLCLHGGPGMPHDYLEPLAGLAEARPVIFYDQLGCGRSEPAGRRLPMDPGTFRRGAGRRARSARAGPDALVRQLMGRLARTSVRPGPPAVAGQPDPQQLAAEREPLDLRLRRTARRPRPCRPGRAG